MIGCSQARLVATIGVAGPASDSPSEVSGWAQMRVGSLPATPSLFHSNHTAPVEGSTNGLGSIDPLRLRSHTNGELESSVKGPSALAATARPMHWRPAVRWCAV